MILTTKEDFEQAVLKGEEIKTRTVFYTGELVTDYTHHEIKENITQSYPVIGEVVERNGNKGIYCGEINGKEIVMSLLHFDEEMTWDEAMKAGGEGYRLPTRAEWLVILENKEIINKSLKKHGGQEIAEDERYWSSSEYSNDYAWSFFSSNGNVYYYNKILNYSVSCLLAF